MCLFTRSNGAGKTSTISAITGVAKSTGSISFENNILTGLSTEDRKAGISLSPEGRRVFTDLTVDENLVLGGGLKPIGGSERIQVGMKHFQFWANVKSTRWHVVRWKQQMLAIARALMNDKKFYY